MNESPKQRPDVSWVLLLSVAAVFVASLVLLRRNVLFTEGEVMQILFTLLIGIVGACVLIGFYRRSTAVWCITLLGGSLLVWQAYQTRKWAVIHEDIISIVRFAEDVKRETGNYPQSLNGYTFKNDRVRSHIYEFTADEADGFRISYFMNHPGITYWHSSKDGFGYYPD